MTLDGPAYLRDPLLRMIPDEPPETFLGMPADEQGWRGRWFLMTWVLTGDEAYSWALALVAGKDQRELVAAIPDDAILRGLRAAEEDGPEPPPAARA